jgi:ParB/RepB/Spo0J family partition protein
MTNSIQSIALDRLVPHPDNPNRISQANFGKLVRNIERSGRYEPLVVRPHPTKPDCFEIINGHHRCRALEKLGYKEADTLIWDVDDEQTDILLATLNRLGGSDEVAKKLMLLKRLNRKLQPNELAKLLPQTAKQIEHLVNLKRPSIPAKINTGSFAAPMVFFVNDTQQQTIQEALAEAGKKQSQKTKAAKNAAALTHIAEYFLNNSTIDFEGPQQWPKENN